jgi:hypothetical protein
MEKIYPICDCGHYPLQLPARAAHAHTDAVAVAIDVPLGPSPITLTSEASYRFHESRIRDTVLLIAEPEAYCSSSVHSLGAGAMKPFDIMCFVKSRAPLMIA